MSSNGHTDARSLHAGLSHPVIDADGHWIEYTPDMTEVVPEADELVGHGLIDDTDFRDFFKGTVVEKAAAEVLRHGA
jgi:hypothetical protein